MRYKGPTWCGDCHGERMSRNSGICPVKHVCAAPSQHCWHVSSDDTVSHPNFHQKHDFPLTTNLYTDTFPGRDDDGWESEDTSSCPDGWVAEILIHPCHRTSSALMSTVYIFTSEWSDLMTWIHTIVTSTWSEVEQYFVIVSDAGIILQLDWKVFHDTLHSLGSHFLGLNFNQLVEVRRKMVAEPCHRVLLSPAFLPSSHAEAVLIHEWMETVTTTHRRHTVDWPIYDNHPRTSQRSLSRI